MQHGKNQASSPPQELIGRRVDLFITELYVGGAEKCLVDLALFLKNRGAHVRVLSLATLPSPPDDKLVQKIRDAKIEVYGLGADRVWNAGGAIMKLRKLLRDSPPHVLQSFLFHANMIASAALVGLRLKPQLQSAERIRWVAGVRVADPRQQRLALESLAFRRADRIVAVSEGARLAYQNYGSRDSDKWLVIPNGIESQSIDAAPISWSSLGLPTDAKVILFVGRLDAQKGVNWLIETATDWLSKLPNHHLVLAGRGPLHAQLQQQKDDLAKVQATLKGKIHLVGWLDQPRRWMRQAEMLLLPAQYEGMPNVCLEAMAEGLPVVAFDVQGLRELLGEPNEGQVIQVQSRQFWADAIVNIATDPKLRDTLGQRNRLVIKRDFQLAQQLERYVKLYCSLIH
jgi:glycosyltransferase involved in cell wall biosynthesis